MRKLLLITAFVFLPVTAAYGQVLEANYGKDDVAVQKLLLLSDLQALAAAALKLDPPLARASAQAEIAEAAWTLDQAWAKELLRAAYKFSLPDEKERAALRAKPIGAAPTPPTNTDRAREQVRDRVLAVALHDRAFANELVQLGASELGHYEEHFRYAVLASKAFGVNDKEAARDFILRAMTAEPTQITAGFVILEIAARDRALADNLTIQYIEMLRTTPLAVADRSLMRARSMLYDLVFPRPDSSPQIAPPGPAVMRAYVSYVLESLNQMAQSDPDGVRRSRLFLLTAWEPLMKYAPELTPAFMELERLSRAPGGDGSLPTRKSSEEAATENYERRMKKALDSEHADETIIYTTISRGDFAKARKLIDKLPNDAQKPQFTDMVNMREALSLLNKNDLPGATRLAEQLTRATSIQQVYPALIAKCGATKDVACASALVYQAMKQLKQAETAPAIPPAGIPASVFMTSRELDPVLASLSKLAQAVLPVSEALAFEVLDEAVRTANASEMDTSLGRTGFDAELFKQFAARNEAHARQSIETFKDPLRQIVARAALCQQQADELTKRAAQKPER